jgi:hypothetical protein
MERVVRAFPILAGKEARVRQLAAEVKGERATEAGEFYRRFGVTHESWHLQNTPAGLWLIGVTEVGASSVAEVATSYARSHESFDKWLKEQIRDVTGINPDQAPLGPPTECILDWSA